MFLGDEELPRIKENCKKDILYIIKSSVVHQNNYFEIPDIIFYENKQYSTID